MTLRKTGLKKLIKKLEKSNITVEKANKITKELAELGKKELRDAYSEPKLDFNQSTGTVEMIPTNIIYDVDQDKNETTLWASGEDLLFYEFGTGVTHNSPRQWENVLNVQIPPNIADIGTYGKGYGAFPYWIYRNKNMQSIMTRGIVARAGFANAINTIVDETDNVVKKVLK